MPDDELSRNCDYHDEVRRARAELAESHQEFLEGKAKPLDVDKLMSRVRARAVIKKR